MKREFERIMLPAKLRIEWRTTEWSDRPGILPGDCGGPIQGQLRGRPNGCGKLDLAALGNDTRH